MKDFDPTPPGKPWCEDASWIDQTGTLHRWDGSGWVPWPPPAAPPNQLAVVTDTLVDIAKKLETIIAFQKEQLTALNHIRVRQDIAAKLPPFQPPHIPLF